MNDLYSGDVQAVFNAAYAVQGLCAPLAEALTFDRGGNGPTSLGTMLAAAGKMRDGCDALAKAIAQVQTNGRKP